MATLDEIAKSFANNPVFKTLDSLPFAAYSMPPGIANMSNAFDAISKLAAPSKDIANIMKYNSIGSNIVNAGLIGSGIGAIANSFHKEHAKFFDAMKMVSESNKLFSQTIAAAVGRPPSDLHGLMQLASQGINASAIGAFTSPSAVKFEPRPTQTDWESLRSIKRPERAPYQTDRVPASKPSLLPPDVEQSFIYFSTLIAKLKTLPPPDVIKTLDWQLSLQNQADRELFLERLAHYLADGKDFSSICWPLIKFWLDSIRGKTPEPTWYSAVGTDARPAPADEQPAGHFAPLLLNYSISQLRGLLRELGLLTYAGQAAPAASPGAWVGIIYGLLDAKPARLRGSKAAIRRAFCETFGARVSERAVQVGLGTNGSEAERFHDSALALLRECASAE
jgi:hypothetical protein